MQLPDLEVGIRSLLDSKRSVYPCHTNRISSLDDPCERKLYYMRAAWAEAAPIPYELAGVFETGNTLEPIIARIAAEVGDRSVPKWRIVGSQTPVNDALFRQFQISGTIDGILQVQYSPPMWENVAVLDGKTMSPHVYPTLNTYEDLLRYPWTRKYRGQLGLYALAFNLEHCVILATNKQNLYEMKFISWPIDLEYLERLLQKAERINAAVAAGEPPAGVNDPDVCPKCQFAAFCAPSYTTSGNLEFVDLPELEAVLDQMGELQETADKWKELEKIRDLMLTRGQDIAVGNWLITWKQSRNGAWRKSISHLRIT